MDAASTAYDVPTATDYDEPFVLETAAFDTAEYGIFMVPAKNVLAISCDNAHARLTAEYVRKIKQPFLSALSADLTETTYELAFADPVDTLILCNINFSSFKISIDGTEDTFSAVKNVSTGRYDAICHLETDGANILSIIITAQTPIDGASFFELGTVCGGVRTQISPWYGIKKKVDEKIKADEADHKNEVVEKVGRSGHIVELVSNYRTAGQMDSILELVAAVRETGAGVLYEYQSDRELIYHVTKEGELPFEQFRPEYQAYSIKLRELV